MQESLHAWIGEAQRSMPECSKKRRSSMLRTASTSGSEKSPRSARSPLGGPTRPSAWPFAASSNSEGCAVRARSTRSGRAWRVHNMALPAATQNGKDACHDQSTNETKPAAVPRHSGCHRGRGPLGAAYKQPRAATKDAAGESGDAAAHPTQVVRQCLPKLRRCGGRLRAAGFALCLKQSGTYTSGALRGKTLALIPAWWRFVAAKGLCKRRRRV